MDETRRRKLFYELSKNSRITTKKIGQMLSISQQSASSLLKKFKEDNVIQKYHTLVDPAKLGFINIIVLYQYTLFRNARFIKKYLLEESYATRIEEINQGADLLVEYTVPNLSFFNKLHKEFLFRFKESIKTSDTYVVVVKRTYTKDYLSSGAEARQAILSGDREIIQLDDLQKKVLKAVILDARTSIIKIAEQTNKDPKTIAKVKEVLQKEKIIRRYSALLNYEQIEIKREHLFLDIEWESQDEITRFDEFTKQHKNIVGVTKTIGPYDVMLTIEYVKGGKSAVIDIRKAFPVRDYRLMESEHIPKYDFFPVEALEEEKRLDK